MALPDVKEIPLNKIEISLCNIRHSNLEDGIDELAESIEAIGLLQPIVVTPKKNGYDVIIGQRRFLAYIKLYKAQKDPKWEKIPAIVTHVKNETEAMIRSFSENVQRLDLEYEDKMQVATTLLKKLGSVEEAARNVGVTALTFRKWLGYAGVPEPIKKMVNEYKLSATTAMRISQTIPDEKRAVEVAEKVREIGRGETKNIFIDLAREKPKEAITKLAEEAKELKYSKVTVHFTKRIFEALTRAEGEFNKPKEEIVREAAEEWLDDEGFME